jgi:hypothetical protein
MSVCMYVLVYSISLSVCLSLLHKCPLSCLPASFLYLSLFKTVFLHFSLYVKCVCFYFWFFCICLVCLSARSYLCPPVSMSSFLCLYVRLSVCPPVSISSSLCLRLSVCPLVSLSTHLDLCLHACACLSVSMLSSMFLSVCDLSLCLYVSVCLCVCANLMACNARAAPNWAYIFQERQWYRPQATQQKGLKVRRGGATVGAD